VLGSSSYAAFSKSALRLPRTFQPRDPPADDQYHHKKTTTQVEVLETTPGEKEGRDMEKQDSINVLKRTSRYNVEFWAKKLTLPSFVLRVLPRYVVKLCSVTQLLEGLFFLGVFLALGSYKEEMGFVSIFTKI
jgi:hypothetical protein